MVASKIVILRQNQSFTAEPGTVIDYILTAGTQSGPITLFSRVLYVKDGDNLILDTNGETTTINNFNASYRLDGPFYRVDTGTGAECICYVR